MLYHTIELSSIIAKSWPSLRYSTKLIDLHLDVLYINKQEIESLHTLGTGQIVSLLQISFCVHLSVEWCFTKLCHWQHHHHITIIIITITIIISEGLIVDKLYIMLLLCFNNVSHRWKTKTFTITSNLLLDTFYNSNKKCTQPSTIKLILLKLKYGTFSLKNSPVWWNEIFQTFS